MVHLKNSYYSNCFHKVTLNYFDFRLKVIKIMSKIALASSNIDEKVLVFAY